MSTVLSELAEVNRPSGFSPILLKHVQVSTLQRLGYLLESVCLNQVLADTPGDTTALLRPDIPYSPQEAFELVKTRLIERI